MNNDHNLKKFIRTSDLSLAATLSVLGTRIQTVDYDDPRRIVFVFEKSENLESLIDRYWRGELSIEPQTYFNQLKVLKTRIYRH